MSVPKKPYAYVTTYCNHAHRLSDGKPIRHECRVIPTAALEAERAGNFETAIALMQAPRTREVRS